ncbi:hypothetical protein Phum_PHUM211470 [Pediculus humanus corporis]|uniref:Uncharacterized protein n=1 Tax=Pediculus humanus subsp. corporis TaxID=121224 RepID=E0VHI4_PEDHC|nr:uncharacterized protein Phum_PHUM211470 [Pediculus humanus corporis]EEB12870.1 hypothetical protein Phum_PHUM211470 [Pediculus humanus corporis]
MTSCTTRPPITLFISKKNILTIYVEDEDKGILVKKINGISEIDLKNCCTDWQVGNMGMNMHKKSHDNTFTPDKIVIQDKKRKNDVYDELEENEKKKIFQDLNFKLSPSEKLMVQEVLDGIDLEDFDFS